MPPETVTPQHFTLESIHVRQFKCFEETSFTFPSISQLNGRWHCITGENATGKTAALEAVCLSLLGPRHAQTLGPKLLGRKRRHSSKPAEIDATVTSTETGKPQTLRIKINAEGVDNYDPAVTETMRETWSALARSVFLSFGSNRDFSETRKPNRRIGETARRHLSLFEPLEPPVDDTEVLMGINQDDFLAILQSLLDLLPEPNRLEVSAPFNQLETSFQGRPTAIAELPGGIRSWLIVFSGIAREWCRLAPALAAERDLSAITGMVLVDEIGLHLSRKSLGDVVEVCRVELPGIQWVVTTVAEKCAGVFDEKEVTRTGALGSRTP